MSDEMSDDDRALKLMRILRVELLQIISWQRQVTDRIACFIKLYLISECKIKFDHTNRLEQIAEGLSHSNVTLRDLKTIRNEIKKLS